MVGGRKRPKWYVVIGFGLIVSAALTNAGQDAYRALKQAAWRALFGAEPAGPRKVAKVAITFEDYFKKFGALDGRFQETQELADSLAGSEVTWDGLVREVLREPDGLILMISPRLDDSRCGAVIHFGPLWGTPKSEMPKWDTKLFSLRRRDEVRVVALLEKADPCIPSLRGLSVSRL